MVFINCSEGVYKPNLNFEYYNLFSQKNDETNAHARTNSHISINPNDSITKDLGLRLCEPLKPSRLHS